MALNVAFVKVWRHGHVRTSVGQIVSVYWKRPLLVDSRTGKSVQMFQVVVIFFFFWLSDVCGWWQSWWLEVWPAVMAGSGQIMPHLRHRLNDRKSLSLSNINWQLNDPISRCSINPASLLFIVTIYYSFCQRSDDTKHKGEVVYFMACNEQIVTSEHHNKD